MSSLKGKIFKKKDNSNGQPDRGSASNTGTGVGHRPGDRPRKQVVYDNGIDWGTNSASPNEKQVIGPVVREEMTKRGYTTATTTGRAIQGPENKKVRWTITLKLHDVEKVKMIIDYTIGKNKTDNVEIRDLNNRPLNRA